MSFETNGRRNLSLSNRELQVLEDALTDKKVEWQQAVNERRKAGNTEAADRLNLNLDACKDALAQVKRVLGHL